MAEEIGRRIAEELSARFLKRGVDLLAQRSKLNFAASTHTSLTRSIAVALKGFNEVAPRDFRLNILWGSNCIIFSFDTTLALTLKVDVERIRLTPAPMNPRLNFREGTNNEPAPSSEFFVTQDKQGFHYQKDSVTASSASAESDRPSQPQSASPILSESQFVDGVIRVACSQPFERHPHDA